MLFTPRLGDAGLLVWYNKAIRGLVTPRTVVSYNPLSYDLPYEVRLLTTGLSGEKSQSLITEALFVYFTGID